MNILISGGAGFSNSGDEALLRTAVQICNARVSQPRIVLAANNPEVAQNTLAGFDVEFIPSPRFTFFHGDSHYNTADEVFLSRWKVLREAIVGHSLSAVLSSLESSSALDFIDRENSKRFLLGLAKADVVMVHGGGILTSATRSRLWEQALTAEIAHSLGKRVLFRSHQFGPYESAEDVERLGTIIHSADYLSTRDLDQSSREVSRHFPGTRIIEQVDDALILDTSDFQDEAILSYHGLNKTEYICVGYRHNPNVGVDESCYEKMARIIAIAYSLYGLPIVLLPQGPFDIPSLQHLASLLGMPNRLVIPSDPFRDPIAIASKASLMIATPHHSLIFALRGGTPVLSPVMGSYYQFKNRGSMNFFGLKDFVIDITPSNTEPLDRAEIKLKYIFAEKDSLRYTLEKCVRNLRMDARNNDNFFAQCLTQGNAV